MKYAEYVIPGWLIVAVVVGTYWGKQQQSLRAIKRMESRAPSAKEPSDG